MGVLAPVVEFCQPALVDDGCEAAGTEGATWRWRFSGVEIDGVPVNLSTVTGVCKIWDGLAGALLATLTVTGNSVGEFTIELDEATTATLAGAATWLGRQCVWGCVLADGTDEAQMWHPSNSPFIIYQEA